MKLKYLTPIALILTCLASTNAYAFEIKSECNLLSTRKNDHIEASNIGSDRDGGIGGTGIFAEITSVSPLKVAGCNVVVAQKVKVIDDFSELKVRDLKVGQFVYMTASVNENQLLTNHIVMQHLLEGPVTKVISDNSIEVMGQIVQLTDHKTHFHINSKAIVEHDYVKVSGLRLNDGSISATRVDVFKTIALAGVTGKLELIGSKYFIGGIAVTGKPEAKLVGNKILAIGKWNGSGLENVRFKNLNHETQDKVSFVATTGVVSKNDEGYIQLLDDSKLFGTEQSHLNLQNYKVGSHVIVFGKIKSNNNLELLDVWESKL
jgi:hypothetical protein